MTVLIDTSAWIEFLRGTGSAAATEVRRLLGADPVSVAMCEPIAMEILSGAVGPPSYERLERLVNGLPSLRVDQDLDFRSAATIYRAARQSGRTLRSITDCLIASVAIRHGAELLHRDADYDVIAGLAPLATRSLR